MMHVLGLEPSRELLMATSYFRGGGGGFRSLCGALSAGIMAMGAVYGRTDVGEENKCANETTKHLCERFLEDMGYVTCEVLRKVYQCGRWEEEKYGSVYHVGAKLATEVILGAHQHCPACGGLDAAIERHLAFEQAF